jgi:hypothetical protein
MMKHNKKQQTIWIMTWCIFLRSYECLKPAIFPDIYIHPGLLVIQHTIITPSINHNFSTITPEPLFPFPVASWIALVCFAKLFLSSFCSAKPVVSSSETTTKEPAPVAHSWMFSLIRPYSTAWKLRGGSITTPRENIVLSHESDRG